MIYKTPRQTAFAALSLFAAMLAGLPIAGCAQGGGPTRTLYSFDGSSDVSQPQGRGAGISFTSSGVTDGQRALQVVFQPVAFPSVYWAVGGGRAWDWSGYASFALDVTNPGPDPLEVGIRIDDDLSSDGNSHCRTARAVIAVGRTATLTVPLGEAAAAPASRALLQAHPMRGLPPSAERPGTLTASAYGGINLTHVVAWQIFLKQPPAARTLQIDNVRLLPANADAATLDDIVDQFGQYTRAKWPGKVSDADEIAKRKTEEEKDLATHPALPGRDEYGGWADGPKLKATGFFETTKRDGKWWFTDPAGHLFLSFGTCETHPFAPTYVQGRTAMFQSLPEKTGRLANHFGANGAQYDFYAANLERKYGPDYATDWRDITLKRFKSWGMNTSAAFSDYLNKGAAKTPWTNILGLDGAHAKLSAGLPGALHDPYDPQFADDVDALMARVVSRIKDDPWCIGTFVDNELPWAGLGPDIGRYDIAFAALASKPGQPAKAAFVAQLKTKYGDIGKLNDAWGANVGGWNTLADAPFAASRSPNVAQRLDMLAFITAYATKYFTIVKTAVKKYDPNHLYLGCRFSWRTPEIIKAAAAVCDVVSFNIYEPTVDPQKYAIAQTLDKPCLVSEFHIGTLDRGMFSPGLVGVRDSKGRARQFKDYLQSVLDNPAFVGAHWFQYVDEPLTGRTVDGENFNIGFVSVTDTPYPELVDTARDVFKTMYARRDGGKK